MCLQSKAAVVILAFALSCTPLLAQQQTTSNTPVPSQASSNDRRPGHLRMREGGQRMWGRRSRGGRFATWHRRGRMAGQMGLGFGAGRGALGLNARWTEIERALRNPQMRQQAGISDQQASKLEQDITSFRKEQIQDRANLAIQRIDLQSLLASQNPDRDAIDGKLQQVGEAELAIEKSSVDFSVTLKQEIPPQQQQKIRQLLRERRDGFGSSQRGMQGRAQEYRRSHRPSASQGAPPATNQ